MKSVTSCISNLLVVSDRATELHGHVVHDVLADLVPIAESLNVTDFKTYKTLQSGDESVGGGEGWGLDRFKFLPIIERVKEANPTAEWFVFIKTDTYIFWDGLFRLLDRYDPAVPLAAVEILTERKIGVYGEYAEPSVSEQYMDVLNRDCCGDSPVISLHKSLFSILTGLAKWESKRDRTNPALYSDVLDYTQLGALSDRVDWDNGDFGGQVQPPEYEANGSLETRRQACHDNYSCLSFTWDSSGKCVFVRTIRLGAGKMIPPNNFTAGWDNSGIQKWRESNKCEAPMWVKPSILRIF
ncbi:hypothetical protein N7490_000038 [Penicillium lividum]|nr:hypothetical protein N7490_000038 [Penicillium lividum]